MRFFEAAEEKAFQIRNGNFNAVHYEVAYPDGSRENYVYKSREEANESRKGTMVRQDLIWNEIR